MRQFLLLIFSFFILNLFGQDYAKNVNPFIGTGGHGHTFPGATVPHGMVQLSPDTRIDGSWDGCSGYYYDDKVIYGFSHTHLNGTGVSDFGDIMLMPTMGNPSFDNKIYSSTFSHKNEKASAGFYSVKLDKDNIDVRLTSSARVGFQEYTFNKNGQANIILDLNHRDKLLEGEVRIIDDKTVEILRRSEAWARNQYVYARLEFNVPMKINLAKANETKSDKLYRGTELALSFSKQVKKSEKILVKVSLSPTDYDGAKLNMSEIKGWDFNKTKLAAEKLWNTELSKIQITSEDKDKLAIFYTALYHTMIQPNIAQDLDGKYRGRDNQIHTAEGFDYYSVFSLWDTFRAAHPLYTLIDKKRTSDYINTFIKQFEQGGRLPVWELASNETDCMIGYHSVSVIADAMKDGIKGFDYEKAFEASKSSAMRDVLGLKAYKENGFISVDDDSESVSKTLEYAYDDWCIAQMAQILNKKEDYAYFMKRSQNWKNLFNYKTGFIQPKKNGGWLKNFDPKEVTNNYTEANGWQYNFFVPQDIPGMIEAFGGKEKFEAKLDEMFNSESKTTGREQADVTGLIGQYAHGNEPSHHMAYLYNYIGKPEKTEEKVKFILDNFYKNSPDGLIGNEDCGQMSAWYVLSSIGLYKVTPGSDAWQTTKPYFNNIKIKIDGKKAENISEVISSLNNFSKKSEVKNDYPQIITVPIIEAESKSFQDKMKIEISSQNSDDVIYYEVLDPDNSNENFKIYSQPFNIDKTSTIKSYIKNKTGESNIISAKFYKKPSNCSISIKSEFNPQYSAGGADALIDGIYGDENWKKGEWQGYQSQDFEAIIDLKQTKKITEISADFLQDSRSWIMMPTKIDYYVSNNNKEFFLIKSITTDIDPKHNDVLTKKYTAEIFPTEARYVKIKAYNFGKLPEWHQGFGGDAFIFIDEIEVK
ncbi:GH92 family glycosyl hydrolase [Halpernia frigidisoli]|uniref:Alpha-1,2-mannosidase, putative n=1 Tax=Halpernia frigidisoli TaxID=1125876 RepID=A0A1I3J020_9FLAO|nr:GH92 family glycosyl hydrolase [Halpernia frigidisoli]SFI53591.1 alpha-1,2-mannosidase, putative [Halpernia frigidisoli]